MHRLYDDMMVTPGYCPTCGSDNVEFIRHEPTWGVFVYRCMDCLTDFSSMGGSDDEC